MPYKITWETKGVLIKWSGMSTSNENIQSNGEIYGNEKFESIKYQIADFLDADTSKFSDKAINIIAKLEAHATSWNKNLKIAHVTTNRKLIRQIKAYELSLKNTSWEFGIFSNVEDARKWVK